LRVSVDGRVGGAEQGGEERRIHSV
jgi:hypothetical protein